MDTAPVLSSELDFYDAVETQSLFNTPTTIRTRPIASPSLSLPSSPPENDRSLARDDNNDSSYQHEAGARKRQHRRLHQSQEGQSNHTQGVRVFRSAQLRGTADVESARGAGNVRSTGDVRGIELARTGGAGDTVITEDSGGAMGAAGVPDVTTGTGSFEGAGASSAVVRGAGSTAGKRQRQRNEVPRGVPATASGFGVIKF